MSDNKRKRRLVEDGENSKKSTTGNAEIDTYFQFDKLWPGGGTLATYAPMFQDSNGLSHSLQDHVIFISGNLVITSSGAVIQKDSYDPSSFNHARVCVMPTPVATANAIRPIPVLNISADMMSLISVISSMANNIQWGVSAHTASAFPWMADNVNRWLNVDANHRFTLCDILSEYFIATNNARSAQLDRVKELEEEVSALNLHIMTMESSHGLMGIRKEREQVAEGRRCLANAFATLKKCGLIE